MAKPKKEGGPKQKLSPGAREKKAARDLAYAKGIPFEGKPTSQHKRKEKKAESQKINCKDGYDYDHNTGKCVLASHNRGGTQPRSMKDGTKAEKKQSKK
jgi:hypothetical protein